MNIFNRHNPEARRHVHERNMPLQGVCWTRIHSEHQ